MLAEWSRAAPAPEHRFFTDLFQEQVALRPDAPALVAREHRTHLRRAEHAGQPVARWLIRQGVSPEQLVAMAVPRSVEMVAALLGVLKAGAAFLPVDPDVPGGPHRVHASGRRARSACSPAERWPEGSPQGGPETLVLDDPAALAGIDGANPTDAERTARLLPDGLAYVVYTSGSTGTPKGVAVTHRGICGLVATLAETYQRPAGRPCPAAGLDQLRHGLRGLAPGALLRRDPRRPARPAPWSATPWRLIWSSGGSSCADMPPSVLATLPARHFPALRVLSVGGEACPPGADRALGGPDGGCSTSTGPPRPRFRRRPASRCPAPIRPRPPPSGPRCGTPERTSWTSGCGRCREACRESCTSRVTGLARGYLAVRG